MAAIGRMVAKEHRGFIGGFSSTVPVLDRFIINYPGVNFVFCMMPTFVPSRLRLLILSADLVLFGKDPKKV